MPENVNVVFTSEEFNTILEYMESINAETVQEAVITAIALAFRQ